MNRTPNFDLKIKAILDATQPGERVCELTGEKWMMDEEEISWYKKFNVPPSKRSPLTRWWLGSSFYISNQWWWQKHPETGKPLLTFIHPATGIKVLPDEEWMQKDFTSEGLEFNSRKNIFEILRELQVHVPLMATRHAQKPENSLVLFSLGDVNSYFSLFTRGKNSMYSEWVFDIEDSMHIWGGQGISSSYHLLFCSRMYGCKFAQGCFDCIDSTFLFDCRNCERCFGATNKRNGKYVFFNEQLSKGEYEKRIAEIDLGKRDVLEQYLMRFRKLMEEDTIWPENFNERDENSTGEYLVNVTNLHKSKNSHDCSDSYYIDAGADQSSDCAFNNCVVGSSRCYGNVNAIRCDNMRFTNACNGCQNLEYSMQCFNCENCFGCIGLNRKKFCIFNKQYSEEEYWLKLDELKCAMLDRNEYGTFFPLTLCPSYVFDSGAVTQYAATREDLLKLQPRLFDPEDAGAVGEDLARGEPRMTSEIPAAIDDLNMDEWANVPVYDEKEKRRFTFIKPEIEFHKRHRIAPPREHFIARHRDMQREGNSGKFVEAHCRKCEKEITVGYNPTYLNRTIYCKPCYLQYLEQHG